MDDVTNENSLFDFAERVKSADHIQEAWISLNAELQKFGFDGSSYGLLTDLRPSAIKDELVLFSTFRPDFIETYVSEGLADHDYVVLHCMQNEAPKTWNDIKAQNATSKGQLYQEITADFGLHDGFAIPFRDRSGLVISGIGMAIPQDDHADTMHLLQRNRDHVLRLCALFDETVKTPKGMRQSYRLSAREVQCLRFICQGKRNQEIADELRLADKTIEHYLERAGRKLNTRNKHHAAAKAALLGIIFP